MTRPTEPPRAGMAWTNTELGWVQTPIPAKKKPRWLKKLKRRRK